MCSGMCDATHASRRPLQEFDGAEERRFSWPTPIGGSYQALHKLETNATFLGSETRKKSWYELVFCRYTQHVMTWVIGSHWLQCFDLVQILIKTNNAKQKYVGAHPRPLHNVMLVLMPFIDHTASLAPTPLSLLEILNSLGVWGWDGQEDVIFSERYDQEQRSGSDAKKSCPGKDETKSDSGFYHKDPTQSGSGWHAMKSHSG